MRLSGHNYNNDVFDSLLNNLPGKIIYKEARQQQQQSGISGIDIFSSTTADDMSSVQREHLEFIANELAFAADRSHVAISDQDFMRFAKIAVDEGLRGKKLERAAQKFCNELGRESAMPMGTTRNSNSPDYVNETTNTHAVMPAGYNPEFGQNNTRTGGYMGMSKNPNTIWDTEAMQRLAQKKFGDEQIRESKEAQKQFREDQKTQFWSELQNRMSQPGVIHEKTASIANVSTVEAPGGNQRLPANAMSIFSNQRDFENIPEQTPGETLAKLAEQRAEKKAESKEQWLKVAAAQKTNNDLSALFGNGQAEPDGQRQNTHRASVDRIFEGLLDQGFIK